jgi:DNA-binding NarL/FixJ family response regulator
VTPIRTIVLSDIRIHREVLSMVLDREAEIEIVSTEGNGDGALAWVGGSRPDVVVVDVAMIGAAELIARLTATGANVNVLAICVPDEDNSILQCVEAGAAAYITREASLSEMISAVTRLAQGEVLCSPRVLRSLATRASTREIVSSAPLTRRELQVIDLIAEGLSNQQISHRLSIELSTVKNHVHNILDKLNVRDRSQAVRWVRAHRNLL